MFASTSSTYRTTRPDKWRIRANGSRDFCDIPATDNNVPLTTIIRRGCGSWQLVTARDHTAAMTVRMFTVGGPTVEAQLRVSRRTHAGQVGSTVRTPLGVHCIDDKTPSYYTTAGRPEVTEVAEAGPAVA